MIGYMLSDRENREMQYILRKELDEMLFDLADKRIDEDIKGAIRSRYKVIFGMYSRSATPKELSRYIINNR